METPFSKGVMCFDDYNYELVNKFILTSKAFDSGESESVYLRMDVMN
jgi:hypothetical protein